MADRQENYGGCVSMTTSTSAACVHVPLRAEQVSPIGIQCGNIRGYTLIGVCLPMVPLGKHKYGGLGRFINCGLL